MCGPPPGADAGWGRPRSGAAGWRPTAPPAAVWLSGEAGKAAAGRRRWQRGEKLLLRDLGPGAAFVVGTLGGVHDELCAKPVQPVR